MGDIELGSRVQLVTAEEAAHLPDKYVGTEIARKSSLWDEPQQRRMGVLVSTNKIINGSAYYVFVMDEPLNAEPHEIPDDLPSEYCRETIKNPRNHMLIINKVLLDHELVEIQIETQTEASFKQLQREKPYALNLCLKTNKAAFSKDLLMTCTEYCHLMCKQDLVQWDESNNRAVMDNCEQFTEEMKAYCTAQMGFVPTFLPTRVLLGYPYWKSESKRKAVMEFCEYDMWVCWCCRFTKHPRLGSFVNCNGEMPTHSIGTKKWCNVTFEFIHRQLFPHGADSEESQILSRDESQRLAAQYDTYASPAEMDNSNPNSVKLTKDLVLLVFDPASCQTFRVHCLMGWTLRAILREVLTVTNVLYDDDMVIYSVSEGHGDWEVELCDFRGIDNETSEHLSASHNGGGSSNKREIKYGSSNYASQQATNTVMASVSDLQNEDILLLRMRSKHTIGARTAINVLGVESGVSIGVIRDPHDHTGDSLVATECSGFRRIGGDGNCYYRAIAYGLLEQIVLSGRKESFLELREIFARVVYPAADEPGGSAEDSNYHSSTTYFYAAQSANKGGRSDNSHYTDDYMHGLLLNSMKSAARGEKWQTLELLQHDFLSYNSTTDYAIIKGCRMLLKQYLITNQSQVQENGLTLKECFLDMHANIEGDGNVDRMEHFCKESICEMGRDAEGPYIELGILPNILCCKCTCYMRLTTEFKRECEYWNSNPSPLGDLRILLRPGHYDLLYPVNAEFPTYRETVQRNTITEGPMRSSSDRTSQSKDSRVDPTMRPSHTNEYVDNRLPNADSMSTVPARSNRKVVKTMGVVEDMPIGLGPEDAFEARIALTEASSSASAKLSSLSDAADSKIGLRHDDSAVSKAEAAAASDLLQMFPDLKLHQAVYLLKAHNYDIQLAANAYLSGDMDMDMDLAALDMPAKAKPSWTSRFFSQNK